jgi:hypothetical protein
VEKEKIKLCPFSQKECNSECSLFIHPMELNEVVRNKLASIGALDRERGSCSLKNLSLGISRILYEQTSGFTR